MLNNINNGGGGRAIFLIFTIYSVGKLLFLQI